MSDALARAAQATAFAAERAGQSARWRIHAGLAVLVLLTMLSYVDRTIIQLLVEPIKADLGIDDIQFSLLTGLSFAVFYAVFGLPFGWLADRAPRRWIIFCGVIAWSIATAMCGLATSFAALFVARMGVGLGEATLSPVGYAIVGDTFPRRHVTLAIGILAAGTVVGVAVANIGGGLLIEWANRTGGLFGLRPWQTAIMLVALPGLLLAPLVFVLPPQADRSTQQTADQVAGYGSWLRANLSHLAPMTFGAALIYTLIFGVTAWMPALLIREFAYTPAQVGGSLGLAFGVSGVVGFIGGGWIVDRLAESRVAHAHLTYIGIAMASLAAVGVFAFALATTSFQILLCIAVMSLLSPVTAPAIAYVQMHTPAAYRGRTIALFLLVFNLFGMTVGPSAVAMVSQLLFDNAIRSGMTTVSLVCGIAGTILLMVARRNEPPATVASESS